jgi:hypothetical protein
MNISTDWLQDVEPTIVLRSPDGKLRLFRKVSINDYFAIQNALREGWTDDLELSAKSEDETDVN